jgi:4-oxalocrotonate tautomerase
MPVVTVSMYEGRTLEQKRELASGITEVVSRVTGVPSSGVHVVINEVKRENWAIGGLLWPDRQSHGTESSGRPREVEIGE